MFVTVAICTWNRAELLKRCLHRFADLRVPPGVDWELLVINNNCTDHTDQVIAECRAAVPLVRVWEPQPGKSFALNTAIGKARGELILWTDDDVLVDPAWLERYVDAARQYPEIDFFGGAIKPVFESPPPRWIETAWRWISGAYAEIDLGDEVVPLDRKVHAFGANFAIRTDVQRRYAYDTRLGRVGANEIRCEESDLQWRMLENGLQGMWVPQANVEHMIPADRLTHDYVRGWQIGIGESIGIMKNEGFRSRPDWAWRVVLLHTRLNAARIRYLVSRHVLSSGNWGKYYARVGFLQGRLRRLHRIPAEWAARTRPVAAAPRVSAPASAAKQVATR